jgi:hypothetical protein
MEYVQWNLRQNGTGIRGQGLLPRAVEVPNKGLQGVLPTYRSQGLVNGGKAAAAQKGLQLIPSGE